MTIKEAEDFYEGDTMQYNFNCREGFTEWFKRAYEENSTSYLDIAFLNNLVNKII
jgi:hypothetical protein